jgi:uncharacterized protein (DUF1015 family)
MPEVFPFRAVRFNTTNVGEVAPLTTQPYDRIDTDLQQRYYDQHPHNIIRIIKRKEEEGDSSGMMKYEKGAETLQEWLKEGAFLQEMKPCIYVYYQTYQTPQGEKTRKGFSAMVRLQEPGKGRILPHEQTHSGPKIDRFRLLSATKSHTEQVFFIYSDPKKKINSILDEAAKREPDIVATDEMGEIHRVWKIMDAATIAAIQKDIRTRDAIIADGHHRYETSWNYCQEMKKQGRKCEGPETYENILATVVNMDDEGMSIFGSHRLCYGIPNFDISRLLSQAKEYFDIREYPFSNEEEETFAQQELVEDLRIEGHQKPCFGVVARGAPAHYLFIVRDVKKLADRVRSKKSEAWRSLDVNILHSVVLEEMVGITPQHLADEDKVEFLRDAGEVIESVLKNEKYPVAFLVNPIRLETIRKIVSKGERFPQKTTDFYPKLLTGLLLCKLNYV